MFSWPILEFYPFSIFWPLYLNSLPGLVLFTKITNSLVNKSWNSLICEFSLTGLEIWHKRKMYVKSGTDLQYICENWMRSTQSPELLKANTFFLFASISVSLSRQSVLHTVCLHILFLPFINYLIFSLTRNHVIL